MTASAHRKKKAATDRGLLLQHGSSTGIWLASCGVAGTLQNSLVFFWQACCSFALTLAVTLARVADAKTACGTSQQPAVRRALQRLLSLQQHRPLPLPPPSGGPRYAWARVAAATLPSGGQPISAENARPRPVSRRFLSAIHPLDLFFFYLHFNN